MRIVALSMAVCLVASACGSVPVVEQVPVPELTQLPPGASRPAVILDRVVFDVPKDTVIGEVRRGKACISPEKLIWRAEGPRAFTEGGYHAEFEQVVTRLGLKVPERPKSLFAQPTLTGKELVFAARIPKVIESRCSGVDIAFFSGQQSPVGKGSVRFVVHWELYSVAEKRVVLALETEGSAVEPDFKPPHEQDYYRRAFGSSLRVLLGRDEVRRLLSSASSTSRQLDDWPGLSPRYPSHR